MSSIYFLSYFEGKDKGIGHKIRMTGEADKDEVLG
jgi:hypothetical protein